MAEPTWAGRFWNQVRKTDGCWEWIGCRLRRGYGYPSVNGKHEYAHRLSWELANGFIPKGLCVLHHCDNPACVRPDHLFLGTQRDNIQDMCQKRRQKQGDEHWSRKHPEWVARGEHSGPSIHHQKWQGEGNAMAKLTRDQVIAIRTDGAQVPKISRLELAQKYQISMSLVYGIINRTFWKWLPG